MIVTEALGVTGLESDCVTGKEGGGAGDSGVGSDIATSDAAGGEGAR